MKKKWNQSECLFIFFYKNTIICQVLSECTTEHVFICSNDCELAAVNAVESICIIWNLHYKLACDYIESWQHFCHEPAQC